MNLSVWENMFLENYKDQIMNFDIAMRESPIMKYIFLKHVDH